MLGGQLLPEDRKCALEMQPTIGDRISLVLWMRRAQSPSLDARENGSGSELGV
jgi:hypothetical protein